MLHLFNTKADVLSWLYALGDGIGLPRGAKEHLDAFLEFRFQDAHSSTSRFEIRNATTGELLTTEETLNYAPTMVLVNDFFRPELEDFELKFELPAVVFAHYEKGFDRTGDIELALFDIQPLNRLQPPFRFSARERLYSVLAYVDAEALGIPKERLEALHEWFNAADEREVRRVLTEHYGQDFSNDEALHPYLSSFNREFGFFFVFLQGKDMDALRAFEARQAANRKPSESETSALA